MIKEFVEKGNGTVKAIVLICIVIIIGAIIIIGCAPKDVEQKITSAPTNVSVEEALVFELFQGEGLPEVGEDVEFFVNSNKYPLKSMLIRWEATNGIVKANGVTANLTITRPGEIKVSSWIEGMEETTKRTITIRTFYKPELKIASNKTWLLLNDRMDYSVVAKGIGPYKIDSDGLIITDEYIASSEPGIFTIWVRGKALSDGREIISSTKVVVFEDIVTGYRAPPLEDMEISRFGYSQIEGVEIFLSHETGRGDVKLSFNKEILVERVNAKYLFLVGEDRKGIRIYEDVFFTIPQTRFKTMTIKGVDGRNWIIGTDGRIIFAFPDTRRYSAGMSVDYAGDSGDGGTTPVSPIQTQKPSPDPTLEPTPTQTQGPSPDPTLKPTPTQTGGPSPDPDPQDPAP